MEILNINIGKGCKNLYLVMYIIFIYYGKCIVLFNDNIEECIFDF